METVAVVGVGLIGGSFALALKEAGFDGCVVGVSSPRTITQALERGVIDVGMQLEQACEDADLVYLAGPILSIIEVMPRLARCVKPGALVTDAGSTKSRIVEAARVLRGRAQFLGGHPMAGKETRGVGAAEAGLFAGRPYLLTPDEASDLETPLAREFRRWLEEIGAVQRVLTPEEHDRVVAHSSHLPQMLQTTLAGLLEGHRLKEQIAGAAGPGLTDSTRLALSSWPIWSDILETNRAEVLAAMDGFLAEFAAVRGKLAEGAVEEEFARGEAFAKRLPRKR